MKANDRQRNNNPRVPHGSTVHQANDGHTSIVRFTGGRIAADQWEKLAQLAEEHGDSTLHLTSRSAIQIRGVHDRDALVEGLKKATLLEASFVSVIASPTVNRDLLQRIDQAVSSVSDLGELSSRLLIGIDDGTGDVVSSAPDFGFVLREDTAHVIIGGELTPHTTTDVAATLSELLELWHTTRDRYWRVHQHPEFLAQAKSLLSAESTIPDVAVPQTPAVGWMQDSHTVTLGFGVPFSTMSAKVAHILGAIGADTTVTTWPSVLIHNLDEGDAEAVAKVLAPQGMIFDANSPWLRVSACVGTRGCARALSDVQSDAMQYAQQAAPENQRVYFSGCSQRCGRPADTTIDYVATGDGEYETNDE